MTNQRVNRGVSLIEVVVVVVVVSILILAMLVSLPRRLETARRASCQRNLMQIGVALALYDQATGHVPTVPALGSPASRAASPLEALLRQLGLHDFRELSDPAKAPNPQRGLEVREQPIEGFVCPSDRNAAGRLFPAPVSYRATTGDTPDGQDGAFAPATPTSLAAIEAGDGAGYTAAFSERLAGNHRPVSSPANYAIAPGRIGPAGCPQAGASDWRGDAGSSWLGSNWQSTLYHHARAPGASPSCVADDGLTAIMGASSGHPAGVNVLLFDGSVRIFTPSVSLGVWRALATPQSGAATDASAKR